MPNDGLLGSCAPGTGRVLQEGETERRKNVGAIWSVVFLLMAFGSERQGVEHLFLSGVIPGPPKRPLVKPAKREPRLRQVSLLRASEARTTQRSVVLTTRRLAVAGDRSQGPAGGRLVTGGVGGSMWRKKHHFLLFA